MVNADFPQFPTNKEIFGGLSQLSPALAAGTQEICAQLAALTQNFIEINVNAGKALSSVKTPQEAVAIQSKWFSQFVETMKDGVAKLSETSAKIANQYTVPLK